MMNAVKSTGLVLILALMSLPGRAIFPSSSFSVNTLLTCLVPGRNGQSVPEERRRVSFQPSRSGTVWLPMESGFERSGLQDANTTILSSFLSTEIQAQGLVNYYGTDTIQPGTPPPSPLLLPVDGSGDQFIPDPDPEPFFGPLDPADRNVIRNWISSTGVSRCNLDPEWTRFPDTYFPTFFAGARCLNMGGAPSCSFPDGLQCEPDISTSNRVNFLPALRWDCCWSYIDKKWVWQCGWRKVEIPIALDCTCACTPKLSATA